jgi:hypothetical protein
MQQVKLDLNVPSVFDMVNQKYREAGGNVQDILAPQYDFALLQANMAALAYAAKELAQAMEAITIDSIADPEVLSNLLSACMRQQIVTMQLCSHMDVPYDALLQAEAAAIGSEHPANIQQIMAEYVQWVMNRAQQVESITLGPDVAPEALPVPETEAANDRIEGAVGTAVEEPPVGDTIVH